MKTYSCIAAGITIAGYMTNSGEADGRFLLTAQQQITMFSPEDFAFSLGGPAPSAPVNGFQIRGVNVNQLPALEGQGISMALVNLDACTINLPHLHPRATEMLYVIEGNVRAAFVEENGGEGAVVNDLSQGDVMFFPQGLIHYQQNLGCEPVTFIAALSNDDPGAVTITTRFFELPIEAIQAAMNFDDPTLAALLAGLPEAPALARQACLEACGMGNPNTGMDTSPDTGMDATTDTSMDTPDGGVGDGAGTAGGSLCNSIPCPDGYTPITDAMHVTCDGGTCEVDQCCEAFCSYHPCPNNFVPIENAGSVRCTDNTCTTAQCCN